MHQHAMVADGICAQEWGGGGQSDVRGQLCGDAVMWWLHRAALLLVLGSLRCSACRRRVGGVGSLLDLALLNCFGVKHASP